MTGRILAVLASGLLVAAPVWLASATAQQSTCLHGTDETQPERTRRVGALRLTRAINTAQARAWGLDGGYAPLEDLASLTEAPEGFSVQLASDEDGYAFTVKDTLDPCGFAYFSDQVGVIYTGEPIR